MLDFPMTEDEGRIRRALIKNAREIAPIAETKTAVFGILGDPNFFSTFSRLCAIIAEAHPRIEFRTEPGISSITAFAAAAEITLSDGFIVSDGDGIPDTRIILKVRHPREQAEQLRSEGYREFILVERMYLPDMKVYKNDNLPVQSEYLSIMVARR
jgi:precorrin-2/cobalt-factor-2 C20-methyltransferase